MKYKRMPAKENISSETGLVQAAHALDAAALVAESTNDVEGLLNVSAMWIKLSRDVHEYTMGVFPPEERTQTKIETGFQRSAILVENEEEEDARDEQA